jgi:hypothetical protein
MLRVDVGESFPISVALWDEDTGLNASGRTVYYDIRDTSDNALSPPVNGVLPESTTESGIYRKELTVNTPGKYICYATSIGFYSSTEEIIVNPESIYDLVKQTRYYNISVEEVLRTNATANASQISRNVGLNKTDYIVNILKGDVDSDWSGATTSGIVYAHYRSITDGLPYKMGGAY